VTGPLVGVDVGAGTLHCAGIDPSGVLLESALLPADDPSALARWCAGAAVVAIDAPEAPSTAPHADDPALAPKFRAARCAEIELVRRHGSWVSWVAPAEPPFPGWMQSGFRAFEALRTQGGPELLEVYPHAGFRELAGGRPLPSKRSVAGRRERAELLARAGLVGDGNEARSHDLVDALMAALIARDRAGDRARRVTCGHDGSAIWLPDRAAGERQCHHVAAQGPGDATAGPSAQAGSSRRPPAAS
jgi:predicted nuclease with RNAse H fold